MKGPVYIIDGYSIVYRSYFAFLKRPLRNPEGRNSSAIFGFFRFLFQIRKLAQSGLLIVAMDSRTPTFRHAMYPQYKVNREKAPDDLHAQVPVIESLLDALGVPCVREDGYEADDIIATIAAKCSQGKIPCYILSGDKDVLQLVDDWVKILHPGAGAEGFVEMGRDEVFQNRSVYPEQIIDYLALTGDSSDNIPGIAGVGAKTASKLLSQYGSLDELFRQVDTIEQKGLREKLLAGKKSAFSSRELVVLKHDLPLKDESLKAKPPDAQKARSLFHREGITTFDIELGEEGAAAEPSLKRIVPGMYDCVLTVSALDKWIDRVRSAGIFAFDSETDGIDELQASPIGFSLAVSEGEACYIPLRASGLARDQACLEESLVREKLSSILTDTKLKMVGQNLKFDYKILKRWGIEIQNIHFDTMVAAWVLDSTFSTYNMDRLARDYLGYRTILYSDLVEKGTTATLADKDIAAVTDYAAEDADITFGLYAVLSSELRERGLEKLFHEIEMPNLKILAEMELAGILVRPEELDGLSRDFETQLREIENNIYRETGREFNINSTKQLQEVLFGDLKLKPIKKIKTGWSTDSQVLELLAEESTICENILKHRTLSKLKSTYADTLPLLINPATGRLHTHYIQTGTATGRLSSKDPNLQNIPVRDEEGRKIRSAFVAPSGFTLLSADYSQIELVVLAHLSGDPKLREAFLNNRDIHTQTSSLLFGVEEQDVTPEMRRIGKTINFGVIYGMSAHRLSRDLKIPRQDAEHFIETYFTRYRGVDRFIRDTIEKAEQRGYTETIEGRQRRLPRINSRNKTEKRAEERIAVNTPIQGSAADIIKKAMIAIAARLRGYRSRLILQVHDELILETAEAEKAEVARLVKETMVEVNPLDLPLTVNIDEGKSWGSIH